MNAQVRVNWQGQSRVVDTVEEACRVAELLKLELPGEGRPSFETVTLEAAVAVAQQQPTEVTKDFRPVIVNQGTAKARIEQQHKALSEAGIVVDTSQQRYETGHALADSGIATQLRRKAEHDKALTIRDAMDELRNTVLAEQRTDRKVTALELSHAIQVNGKVSAFGYALREQAIRGLLLRLESPATPYVMGLRERISTESARGELKRPALIQADKQMLGHVLAFECVMRPDVELTLRCRNEQQDIFAVVSPSYSSADAPEVLSKMERSHRLPEGAKGTYSYDPDTTDWELRASVWTPTQVAEQAVGEPFEGYVSFRSSDDGTGAFRGGGGITLLRCLNASTYSAGSALRRRHIGNVMADIGRIVREGNKAIDALCAAWGTARRCQIEIPPEAESISGHDLIAGLFLAELRNSKSELNAVLPGKTIEHANRLADLYLSERRDPNQLVRADLANAWTRYVQSQPSSVRREAEAAIGDWVTNPRPMGFLSATLG